MGPTLVETSLLSNCKLCCEILALVCSRSLMGGLSPLVFESLVGLSLLVKFFSDNVVLNLKDVNVSLTHFAPSSSLLMWM